jgi:hypothetical protein
MLSQGAVMGRLDLDGMGMLTDMDVMHEYAQVTCKSLLRLLSVCQRRRRRERRWAVDKYTHTT